MSPLVSLHVSSGLPAHLSPSLAVAVRMFVITSTHLFPTVAAGVKLPNSSDVCLHLSPNSKFICLPVWLVMSGSLDVGDHLSLDLKASMIKASPWFWAYVEPMLGQEGLLSRPKITRCFWVMLGPRWA